MRFYLISGIIFLVFSLIIRSSEIDPYFTIKVSIYLLLAILFLIYEIFNINSLKRKLGQRLFVYDHRFGSKRDRVLGKGFIIAFLAIVLYLQFIGFSSVNIAFNIWMLQIIVGGLYRAFSLQPWVMENGLMYHGGIIAWNQIDSFRWKETAFGNRKGLIQLILSPKPKVVQPIDIPIYVNKEVVEQLDKKLNDIVLRT